MKEVVKLKKKRILPVLQNMNHRDIRAIGKRFTVTVTNLCFFGKTEIISFAPS
jgi:hypothetical protein